MLLNIDNQLRKNDLILQLLEEKTALCLINVATDQRIWQSFPESYHDPIVFREKWLEKAFYQMKSNKRICFAVSWQGQVVGSSSYYKIDFENKKLNIGYTWFHPNFWGSQVNPLTKLIMLEYVFEQLAFNKVEFSVDSQNIPSCRALEKFGIKCNGIKKSDFMLADGRMRDSVIYSIVYSEWLEIKQNIQKFIKGVSK